MERLRSHLGIGRWVVVGGLWGVTLALVYAQRHPERVLGMVLAAVTSGRWRETQWITRDMGRVFPRQWDRFTELLPEAAGGGDLAAAYARPTVPRIEPPKGARSSIHAVHADDLHHRRRADYLLCMKNCSPPPVLHIAPIGGSVRVSLDEG
jgi:pimeloyl-ACP methyl ester carboxylesterase